MTLAFILGGGAVVLALYGLDRVATAIVHPKPRPASGTPHAPGVRVEAVEIHSEGRVLEGWLLEPAESPPASVSRGMALLTHGWGSSHEALTPLARELARGGCTVLLFDVRGHGANPPEPYVTARDFRDDVRAAARFVRERHPGRPLTLVGHSMGAAASVLAAAEDGAVEGVALVACPADVLEVTALYLRERGLPGNFMVWALRPFWWPRVGGTFRPLTPERRIAEVRAPLLLIQPEYDARVPRSHAERLGRAAGREVWVVPGAGHTDVLRHPEVVAELQRFVGGA